MDKTNENNIKEQEIYKHWEERGYFKASPSSSKKPYSMLIPPPNVNGILHLGHAMQHAILDALARFKRMQGYDVLLLPGVDHAGILFEGTLNKMLEKEGLNKQKLGREKWMGKAWQLKDEVYQSFHKIWTVFGLSADWSREVFTLEPKVQMSVLAEFQTFWDQDLLYKGAYIVQWCPKCGTAIEDLEMEYQEKKEKLYYVKYSIVNRHSGDPPAGGDSRIDSGQAHLAKAPAKRARMTEFISVATARPETIAADVAIAIYPNHSNFKKFVGKYTINPFTKTKIPVIEDKRVQKDFGTGALKITPGHDLLDYEIGKAHGLPILHVISKEGKVTDLDPELQGLKIIAAREKAIDRLNNMGLIDKEEEYSHMVPVCERCKTTVEPLISEEWFVKMKPLAAKALKNLNKINFLPENYGKIISDWLKNIHDWCISRSLWWGHRIPVWYCEKCNPNRQVGKDKAMVISLEKPVNSCMTCKKHLWAQDEQVLDAWFSSGMWPLATLNWPSVGRELKRYYPWNFEITAPEIKYLWITRMIMLGLWFRDEIPFKNMFFHGMLRDMQGRKFSKSLGNGIEPNILREQWGTDTTRMALYTYSAPGRDAKVSKQIMDERCKNFRNFGTKIRNIYRFIYELNPDGSENRHSGPLRRSFSEASLSRIDSGVANAPQNDKVNVAYSEDKAIVKKLDILIKEVTKNIEQFNLHLAVENLYNFTWHDFADIYIEQSKKRRVEAQPVLEHVFVTSLKLLHPFMPFLTEELYLKLPQHKESIMIEEWPDSLSS
jgi:valyl-tRNA synthetase